MGRTFFLCEKPSEEAYLNAAEKSCRCNSAWTLESDKSDSIYNLFQESGGH